MNSDDLARLSARLDARIDYWRSLRRDKAAAYLIEEALDLVNRDLDRLSDAIVLAHTAPKVRKSAAPAPEAAQ